MRVLLFIAVMLLGVNTYAGELGKNAAYIKENYSAEYDVNLKKHALEKWKDDFEMAIYELNLQADGLITLIQTFKGDNTSIVINAMKKWGHDDYKITNDYFIDNLKSFDLKSLLKIHCDWQMVKYEYDLQVKAKNSF